MKEKLLAGLLISLTVFVFVGMAEATHIQFFDFANLNTIDGTIVSTSSIGIIDNADVVTIAAGSSYSYTFDLLAAGSLDLFDLDDSHAYIGTGAYDLNDYLHEITLRIDPNNVNIDGTQGAESTSTYIGLEVNGVDINPWSNPTDLYSWAGINLLESFDDPYNIIGIDRDWDYQINVVLTNNSNSAFIIDNINVEGCFGAAPVPEPATMLLFGTGLVGLVGSRLRKKKK